MNYRQRLLAASFATLGVVACAHSPSSTGDPTGTSSASVSCTPTGSSNGQPITDPNGPYGHQTVIAQSANGLTLTNPHQVIDHASVPDGVRRADGSVYVYSVNGAAGATWVARIVLAIAPGGAARLYVCGGGIVVYRSTDNGHNWQREHTVVGPGFNTHPIVCDPSFVAGAGLFVFKTG